MTDRLARKLQALPTRRSSRTGPRRPVLMPAYAAAVAIKLVPRLKRPRRVRPSLLRKWCLRLKRRRP